MKASKAASKAIPRAASKAIPRALVIAPQPFFTCRGTPLSVYYRTLVTAELGIGVDLLTYGEGEDIDIPGVNIIRIPHFGLLGPVKIGPSALKLFLDIFMVLWTIGLLTIGILRRRRYEIVHAHEEAVFFCWLLKPLFRFKLIYDMHSSLPEQLSNFEFTQSRWLIGTFAWLERRCLQAAEVTMTICPSLDSYAQRLASPTSWVTLIENSIFEDIQLKHKPADTPLLNPALQQTFAQRQVVIYAGTLEAYQGIDILILGMARAIARNPTLFLLIVGGTPAQIRRYSKLAADCGIGQHCQFIGRVSPRLARAYADRAAVQVSPRTSGTNTPLKVYEQIARSVPLVATNIYSHTQVLDDSVAFLVAPTPQGMADGMIAAASLDAIARQVVYSKVSQANQRYEKRYSRRIYTDKMSAAFTHLGIAVKPRVAIADLQTQADPTQANRLATLRPQAALGRGRKNKVQTNRVMVSSGKEGE